MNSERQEDSIWREDPRFVSLSWNRAPLTTVSELSFATLLNEVPKFSRHPFSFGTERNPQLDTIVREPFKGDDVRIPVGIVSRTYCLVQHTELVQLISDALSKIGIDDSSIPVKLTMTEFGEWAQFTVSNVIPDHDPGDGYPLQFRFHVRNSVEGSSSLLIYFGWYRLICSNGLAIFEGDKLMQIHSMGRLKRAKIERFIEDRIRNSRHNLKEMEGWLQVRIDEDAVSECIDNEVKVRWGNLLAARLYHVYRTGFDGRVSQREVKNTDPTKVSVSSDTPVPGLPDQPSKNLYHFYQCMLWFSRATDDHSEREKMAKFSFELCRRLRGRSL